MQNSTNTLFFFYLLFSRLTPMSFASFDIFPPPTFLVANVSTCHYIQNILTCFSGATNDSSTSALMEKLHLKYQQRPWTETLKLVHFCMVRIADQVREGSVVLHHQIKKKPKQTTKPFLHYFNTLEVASCIILTSGVSSNCPVFEVIFHSLSLAHSQYVKIISCPQDQEKKLFQKPVRNLLSRLSPAVIFLKLCHASHLSSN